MDKENIGTMELVGVPKEFRPNKHERKSPWAIIIILITLIGFGAFFYIKKQAVSTSDVGVYTPPPAAKPSVDLDSLEASVGTITIPDYSDIL